MKRALAWFALPFALLGLALSLGIAAPVVIAVFTCGKVLQGLGSGLLTCSDEVSEILKAFMSWVRRIVEVAGGGE